MALRLIIEDDEGTTTVVPLGADAITIGRQQGNTIQLTEKNVSRRHARLSPEPDDASWSIEDLGSYNGLKINGAAVEARNELKEGDVVQIGDYHLTLTENADKTAVSPAPTAANDGVVPSSHSSHSPDDPMLASSSNDLPRLSTEDLAALQSGPVPIHSMGDSGAVPAVAGPTGQGFEEERRSSTGLLIGAGAVVVGALVFAFAWMAGSGNDDGQGKIAAAGVERPTVVEDPRATMAATKPGVVEEPGIVEPDAGEPDVEPEGIAADPVDPVVDSKPQPASRPKKPRRKTNPKVTKKTPPPATAPAKPAVDVDALLKDAKKASFGKFSQCYDLAKKAHDASRSAQAANLMGACACKMGDEGKAKRAVTKLRGAKKDNVVKLCAAKGITL
ncbi:MAG: FHA domain-containing protein [Nannocystaceae bacterium]|nr:FHA domain-containing protein [Nannocystaceae bacterium]